MKHLSFRFICSLVSMILLLSLVTCFAESNDENSITDCVTEIIGIHPIITVQLDSTVEACAQYMLFPNYILAGPGGDKAELEKYLHPDLGTWDKNELWSIYGSIVQYLYEHSSEAKYITAPMSTRISAIIIPIIHSKTVKSDGKNIFAAMSTPMQTAIANIPTAPVDFSSKSSPSFCFRLLFIFLYQEVLS